MSIDKEPAKLTAELLARKGAAAPAGFTPVAVAGNPRMPRASALIRREAMVAVRGQHLHQPGPLQ